MLSLAVKKCMRAFTNVKRLKCAQCGKVGEQMYQFWSTFAGDAPLEERIIKKLPVFCSANCWRRFVDGAEWSDRGKVRDVCGGLK